MAQLSAGPLGIKKEGWRVKRFFVGTLAVIGAIASALVLTCGGLSLSDAYLDMHPTTGHLEYIINWAELGPHTQIVEIERACADLPNLMQGDRVRAYKLRLAAFPPEVLKFGDRNPWVKPPLSDPLLVQAISTAAMFVSSDGCTWFPSAEDLNSERFYLSFPQLSAFHGQVEGVDLTALEIATQALYHAEVRW